MVWLWFVSRQMLASGNVALMVKVEMLTPGQGPPGYELFDIETVGRISTAVVGQATPYRAVQQASRLRRKVGKGGTDTPIVDGQVGQGQSNLLLFGF